MLPMLFFALPRSNPALLLFLLQLTFAYVYLSVDRCSLEELTTLYGPRVSNNTIALLVILVPSAQPRYPLLILWVSRRPRRPRIAQGTICRHQNAPHRQATQV